MNAICKMFGHQPEEGYYRDDPDGSSNRYLTISMIATDGMGHKHAYLHTICRRCKKDYRVGMVSLPKEKECSCSSADEEHLTTNQKVAGSTPARSSKSMFKQIQDDVCEAVRPVLDKWKPRIKRRKASSHVLLYYVSEGVRDAIYKPKDGE